jgi:hypothetical protein
MQDDQKQILRRNILHNEIHLYMLDDWIHKIDYFDDDFVDLIDVFE